MIAFDTVPELGTIIKAGKVKARLIAVSPYIRKDGRQSQILHWQDEYGRTGTTGLKANSMQWQRKW
jgi:hypothetical protein